jgi:hypothetical protein
MFKRLRYVTFCCILPFGLLLEDGCDSKPTADQVQSARQEKIQAEIAAQTGMPAIKNGREAKLVKMIYEMRDQNISTYTYTFSELTGKFRFFGETVGYGVPYSTQYSAPTRMMWMGSNHGYHSVPQAEPNGLYPPNSAEGTWILMKDPHGTEVSPLYVEPKITVSPFKLPEHIVARD